MKKTSDMLYANRMYSLQLKIDAMDKINVYWMAKVHELYDRLRALDHANVKNILIEEEKDFYTYMDKIIFDLK